jgi:hypothetical protein
MLSDNDSIAICFNKKINKKYFELLHSQMSS